MPLQSVTFWSGQLFSAAEIALLIVSSGSCTIFTYLEGQVSYEVLCIIRSDINSKSLYQGLSVNPPLEAKYTLKK